MSNPSIAIKNLNYIKTAKFLNGYKVGEALDDINAGVGQIAGRLTMDPNGNDISPPPIAGVAAQHLGNGIVDVAVSDPNQITTAVSYHVEYDTSPSFNVNPRYHFLGPSRNATLALPNGTYWLKSYSQFQYGGSPSTARTTGPVVVTGSATGKLMPTQGSGTGLPGQTGVGFGTLVKRKSSASPGVLALAKSAAVQLSNPPPSAGSSGGSVPIVPSPVPGFTPNQVQWEEDFTSNPGMASGLTTIFGGAAIGQQGWYLNGATPHTDSGVIAGGSFPFAGYAFWGNTSTPSAAARLFPAWMFGNASLTSAPASNADWNSNPLPLFDYPGWQFTFIFRFNPTLSLAASFAQKSFYVGLFGINPAFYNQSNGSSRPDKFVGLRFDTDPTSPALSDSKFTLEAVVNPTIANTPARNNTQGTTKVTSVAPAVNTVYRLDITCSTAGQVTITLNQSGTDTLTCGIPTDTINIGGNFAAIFTGGVFCQNQTRTGFENVVSFGSGSKITFSGITTASFIQLNGVTVPLQTIGFNGTLYNIQGLQTGLTNEGATPLNTNAEITGFPAIYPGVWFGNDSQSAPTADTGQIETDKIYFNWVS